ncbi:DUF3078 domain-containing protein [Flavobacterium facile]|uniref:DUF3078 domain-containing protein n=1 Tax=Flavobacterium facile TaxID=2893174 RepID=UPI002E793392|nr:DUF3078 domain-containing protein [Flavobacterium sp. T-12]
MIKRILFFTLLVFSTISFSQIIRTEKPDTISHWKKINKVGIDFTQITFVNWSAGGNNSISGLAKGQFIRNYLNDNKKWDNELIIRYGINKQESQDLRKTDDQINLNSTLGYRRDTISNWYYGGKFSFLTQFANGYSYPNVEQAISKPFAPAYIFLGVGAEYSRKDLGFNIYLSPLTEKTTLVLDRRLSNSGAFGVDKAVYDETGTIIVKNGKRHRTELGALINSQYKTKIMNNIMLDTRATLYTDYLKDFGNIDIDWQLRLEMVVNKYVRANIGTHLLYDNDIKNKREVGGVQITEGPRVQWKQILGVGLEYTF